MAPTLARDPALVSVIIPTHNRRAYLEESIESVRAQTHVPWEIIVVDNASSDGTWEWLEQQRSERLRCTRLGGKSGSTVARNAGLRMARGESCLFLDDDDLLPPDALALHVDAIGSRPDLIGTVGSVALFNERGTVGRLRPSGTRRIHDGIWRDVHFWWGFLVGASLFRASALERIGGFDESITFYGDDTDLWMRLGHLGPVALLPEDVVRFRYHGQKRPADFWEFQTELRERQAERLSPTQRAIAKRIHRARSALHEVRRGASEPRKIVRSLRLLAAAARCPFLFISPVSSGEIRRALRGH